jgi:hypothetical protein
MHQVLDLPATVLLIVICVATLVWRQQFEGVSLRLGPSPHWAVTTLVRRRSARLKIKEGRAWNAAEFLRISSGLGP